VSLDVVILAGGLGTRLRGLWDGPKCLVPVGGVPLLQRLFALLAPLRPRQTTVVLGHLGSDVKFWAAKHDPRILHGYPDAIVYPIEPEPRGTAAAVRFAIKDACLRALLLVLNGDTLPRYDLGAFVAYHRQRVGCWATIAAVHDTARWRDVYAGAAVLSQAAMEAVKADDGARDIEKFLLGADIYRVPDFLDVGTPEGFQRAKEWRDE